MTSGVYIKTKEHVAKIVATRRKNNTYGIITKEKTEHICPFCGKKELLLPWQIKYRIYCSKKCWIDNHIPWNKGFGEYMKKEKHPFFGKKRPEISIGLKKAYKLGTKRADKENNSNWKGGLSFELYPEEFNDELKHLIRKKYKFTCQVCKKNGWCIHHIDYDKKNSNPNNLIALCRSCHMKTNFNRNYWIKFFKNILK